MPREDKMQDQEPAPYIDVENCAVRLLSRRDHSRLELERKLKKREFEDDLIQEVLRECERRGWINDQAFAERQAEILAKHGWGPLKINQKLYAHGVSSAMAREAVDALDVDWDQACRRRMESRFGEDAEETAREKAVRHLRGRGFAEATIRRVILDGAG